MKKSITLIAIFISMSSVFYFNDSQALNEGPPPAVRECIHYIDGYPNPYGLIGPNSSCPSPPHNVPQLFKNAQGVIQLDVPGAHNCEVKDLPMY
ncbi:hypothetical protein OS175_10720 [Marinicella sp. S1101]|uniref:hypothetical protein n=1 Tax=Marinicella marina TaxID=2996016 RepID=UPI002260948D|nr:hypothetical protein [Marinicella marina]MCX7554354.1 hypothetical protein [Marinicella marina]MDJ1138655.1 hypothetical protein [Marinicella marina]